MDMQVVTSTSTSHNLHIYVSCKLATGLACRNIIRTIPYASIACNGYWFHVDLVNIIRSVSVYTACTLSVSVCQVCMQVCRFQLNHVIYYPTLPGIFVYTLRICVCICRVYTIQYNTIQYNTIQQVYCIYVLYLYVRQKQKKCLTYKGSRCSQVDMHAS